MPLKYRRRPMPKARIDATPTMASPPSQALEAGTPWSKAGTSTWFVTRPSTAVEPMAPAAYNIEPNTEIANGPGCARM